jgi:hypothetical protein
MASTVDPGNDGDHPSHRHVPQVREIAPNCRSVLAIRFPFGQSARVIGDAFRTRFVTICSEPSVDAASTSHDPQLVDVFNALGGVTADNGLYRIYSTSRARTATAMVEAAIPEVAGRIECFASDWLGRHFALDRAREDCGENLVLMLEPGTGQALEIPASVRRFHDTELVDFAEEALAVSFYRAWRESSGDRYPLDEETCVGYATPLFLGGADDAANLARTDMSVYWHLMGELRAVTLEVEPGSHISSVRIDE